MAVFLRKIFVSLANPSQEGQKKERQSDIVVSGTLCERMLHESQRSKFLICVI